MKETLRAAVAVLIMLAILSVVYGSDVRSRTSDGSLPAKTSTPSKAAPDLEEIENATYRGLDDHLGDVTLVHGSWQGKPYVEAGAVRPEVNVISKFRMTGDLDRDGTDEAVVLLEYRPGGTGELLYAAVVGRRNSRVVNVATAFIGDRVQVRGGHIENRGESRVMFLDVVQAGPEDPACCPGDLVTRGWLFESDGTMKPIKVSDIAGRLSLDTIGGTEWVLHSWAIKEPAPPDPEVTLVYKDGRFAGTSGCNRYSAPVREGNMPGEVSVGPAATTKMACGDVAASVEERFLRALGGVRKFGFRTGELALSYEKEGSSEVMLFGRRTRQAGSAPQAAYAEGPSFDCKKPSNTVEKMICNDSLLSFMDTEMAVLYRDVLARVPSDDKKKIQADQRRWLKARNGCVRDTNPRDCIIYSFEGRISLLRHYKSMYPSADSSFESDELMTYRCDDNSRLVVTIVKGDPPEMVDLRMGDLRWQLARVVSASGTKYAGGPVTFWTKGKEAQFVLEGQSVRCLSEE